MRDPRVEADDVARLIQEAKEIATLEGHKGWELLRGKFVQQRDDSRRALEVVGLDQGKTEQHRHTIYALNLILEATARVTPESVGHLEKRLAELRNRAKMLEERGLSVSDIPT